jgi:hypothetical protein
MKLSTDDYIAIQQLYVRYAFAVDLNDRETLVEECWTEDGEYVGFRPGGQPHVKGREALRAFGPTELVPNENGYHWNAPPLIEPTDYGASGRCYLLHVLARDDGTFGAIHHVLYYQDELVKQDGRWLFRRRHTTALPEGRNA